MGEDNKPCTAYLVTDTGERVPVDMENLPEITPGEMDKLADAARALAKVAEAVTVTFEVAAEAFGKWIRAIADAVEAEHEMETALRWASCYYRPAFHRYHHTKKKRIRKKYAKRILEWYRTEVVANGLRNI